MDKPVLVYAEIDKHTEIDNVSHRTLQFHAGLQVGEFLEIGAEGNVPDLLAWVAPRLFQLGHDVRERRDTESQRRSESALSDGFDTRVQLGHTVAAQIGLRKPQRASSVRAAA